ncbi:phosphoethanolamine transferase [Flagellimonas sp.]|uniref:phosphoethanolamine transferase n=1 Tax=Flagellimonas sp. TaxID=2058762 RepID=UPI003F49F0DE
MGFFIDHELSDSFAVLVNLMWMLLVTIPYCIFQKKIIYQIGVCVYFVLGFIEIGHWIIMKGPLTIKSLLVIGNSNYEEAVSFLSLKSSWALLLLVLYTVLFIFAFRTSPKKLRVKNNLVHIAAIVVIFALMVFGLRNTLPKYRFLPQAVRISYAFVVDLSDFKKAIERNVLLTVDAKLNQNKNQQQVFVLILGESCSRNHMSLYGWNRKTNPRLGSRKDIIKYTDVVAGYNYTMESIPSILSDSNLENRLGLDESVDIIDVFHSAGFETFWISNQAQFGALDNIISSIAMKTDNPIFVNNVINSSPEALFSKAHDGKLLEPFNSALSKNDNNKLIVLHLMGSHNTYNKRYPPSFERFKGKDSRKDRLIAEYDNSVLYNDFVVDSVLGILDEYTSSNKNRVASAIYVSDHGENVFDEKDGIGHEYSKEMPRVIVEIPFITWLSAGYLEMNKSKVTTIVENKDKPYVTDDLFHAMIDINNIKTPLLDETKSVFNKKFNYKRQRILVDGKDYDRR